MFKKTKVRSILELLAKSLSAREVSRSLGVSRNTVAEVQALFLESGKSWDESIIAWICMFVLCITAVAGCGEKEGGAESPQEERKKGKELPEDSQWNHGVNAIMETEAGYYVNVAGNTGRELGYQGLRGVDPFM